MSAQHPVAALPEAGVDHEPVIAGGGLRHGGALFGLGCAARAHHAGARRTSA